jgi:hypothetical protein
MGGLNSQGGERQLADQISAEDRAQTYGAALGLLFDATCVIDPRSLDTPFPSST